MPSDPKKKPVKKLIQEYTKGLAEERIDNLWDQDTEVFIESVYDGLICCLDDELYLQEFLPFGYIYRLASLQGARRRIEKTSIEDVMEEHIVLRDVFWDYRRGRSEKQHDFATERRICQCFDSVLQATLQAYKASTSASDVLGTLRDTTTGVFTNLYFATRLEEEVKRSERYLRDVTVLLFQITHKLESDSQDEVELMRAIARVLRRFSRASDIIARVDDSRFAALLPETRSEDAAVAATRLKNELTSYLDRLEPLHGDVEVEVGLASYPEHGDEGNVLLEEAVKNMRGEAFEDQ